jgi:hypothetical protein
MSTRCAKGRTRDALQFLDTGISESMSVVNYSLIKTHSRRVHDLENYLSYCNFSISQRQNIKRAVAQRMWLFEAVKLTRDVEWTGTIPRSESERQVVVPGTLARQRRPGAVSTRTTAMATHLVLHFNTTAVHPEL